jgi:2-iminobutanoate/2-iminopropanoate deaminase
VIAGKNVRGRQTHFGGVSMQNDRIVHPERTTATGAYSDGVLCDGWLYISGQGALDLKTGKVVGESIEEQVRITMKNIGNILEAAGCTFDDLVKCNCHLKNIEDFNAFDRVYAEHFPRKRPARTTVQSVLGEGLKVEIDGIARKNRGEGHE